MTTNLLLVGVGGQGTILTSKILAEGLALRGWDVKMSEIHGMAQRGGSVTTQIRFGRKVLSPIIGLAEADLLVAFEKAEAARHIGSLKPDGILLVNDYEIRPLPVLTGAEKYPADLKERLAASVRNVKFLNAFKLASDLGNGRAQSIVMLGAIVKALEFEEADWPGILRRFIPENSFALNEAAFEAGFAA